MNKKTLKVFISLLAVLVCFSTCPITKPIANAQNITVPGFSCYRNLGSIYQTITRLENQFPEWVAVNDIGDSWEKVNSGEGHDLFALRIEEKNNPDPKPSLFLVSGLKANAFGAMEINLRFAEYLLNQATLQDEVATLLEHFSIHFVFVANPDGRAKAESQATGEGISESISWKKNTNTSACEGELGGVSLEQNFLFQWRNYPNDGCDPKYPGLSAESEPETQAIATYLRDNTQTHLKPSFLINLESWQDALITPYLYSKTHHVENFEAYQILANKLLYSTFATPLPGTSEFVELQTGSLVDYAQANLGMVALLYRFGTAMGGGDVPDCTYFENVLAKPAMQSLLRALKSVPAPLSYAAGPEVLEVKVSEETESQRFHISGSLDANSFYRDYYGDPFIYSACFTLNLPPWLPGVETHDIENLTPNEQNPRVMDFSFYVPKSDVPTEGLRVYIQGTSIDPARNNSEDAGFVYRLTLKSIDPDLNIYFPFAGRAER